MVNSFFKCEFGGRVVTVWPSVTGEPGFYDVTVGDVLPEFSAVALVEHIDGSTTIDRVTAFEAAGIVVSELGVPLGDTVASVAGMIGRWRAEFDSMAWEPVG